MAYVKFGDFFQNGDNPTNTISSMKTDERTGLDMEVPAIDGLEEGAATKENTNEDTTKEEDNDEEEGAAAEKEIENKRKRKRGRDEEDLIDVPQPKRPK